MLQEHGRRVNLCRKLQGANVDCAGLLAVFRIGLRVERYLLTLCQSLVTVNLDRRDVYKYLLTGAVVGNETISFLSIKPLNCTVIHRRYLH